MRNLLLIALVSLSSSALAEDKFAASAADLQAAISKETARYRPVGNKTSGHLDNAAPKTVELKRGFCYFMVVRLATGATWSEHTKKDGVNFYFNALKGDDGISGGPGVVGPGALSSGGCPQKAGRYEFNMAAFGDGDKRNLGTGGYTLQLMAKPTTAKELHKRQAEADEQYADLKSFARDRTRNACAGCEQERDDCLDGKRKPFVGGCMESYKFCMQRTGITAKDCR